MLVKHLTVVSFLLVLTPDEVKSENYIHDLSYTILSGQNEKLSEGNSVIGTFEYFTACPWGDLFFSMTQDLPRKMVTAITWNYNQGLGC
ncbi:hypothetical protein [Methylophaga sp.]|uniref:hypothetical protein n=1 Tax=Methylophaga sp. TaxID=2024840 RepID=UPI003F69960C